jgi:hypothetical protein
MPFEISFALVLFSTLFFSKTWQKNALIKRVYSLALAIERGAFNFDYRSTSDIGCYIYGCD